MNLSLPLHPANTPLDAPNQQWGDWKWQARHALTTLKQLQERFQLTPEEVRGTARALVQGLPLSVTPYYASLGDPVDPHCPIRQQCIPNILEDTEIPGDLQDPLGEEKHEVAPHLVQRYPDRALLLVTDRCGVYCRFCTRSRMVGQGTPEQGPGARNLKSLEPAFQYLRNHPEVQDVIVSGGDPGLLSDARIAAVLEQLANIKSVQWVRFATRTPVTLPQRVTPGFCQALRSHPSLWLMTHFNHPKEITPESEAACAALVNAGIPVMNQSVLLRGINDDVATLESLFRGLVRIRVRPYYLLQADPVRGTGHFRTPLQTGLDLMAQIQGRVSGIAVPKFIVDTPGGHGKVAIQKDPVISRTAPSMDLPGTTMPGTTTLRTFRGEHVDYVDPA